MQLLIKTLEYVLSYVKAPDLYFFMIVYNTRFILHLKNVTKTTWKIIE